MPQQLQQSQYLFMQPNFQACDPSLSLPSLVFLTQLFAPDLCTQDCSLLQALPPVCSLPHSILLSAHDLHNSYCAALHLETLYASHLQCKAERSLSSACNNKLLGMNLSLARLLSSEEKFYRTLSDNLLFRRLSWLLQEVSFSLGPGPMLASQIVQQGMSRSQQRAVLIR